MDTQEFVESLKEHPKLRKRFEEILKLAKNSNGEINLADEAEQMMVEQGRQLGQEVLQSWANGQEIRAETRIKRKVSDARKHVKKN